MRSTPSQSSRSAESPAASRSSRANSRESAGPLRGLKRDVFEGGHRVPFLVRWPGVIEAGTVVDALVGQVDLMATFASILGQELPPDAALLKLHPE